jgi:hypothetical protein
VVASRISSVLRRAGAIVTVVVIAAAAAVATVFLVPGWTPTGWQRAKRLKSLGCADLRRAPGEVGFGDSRYE